MATPPDRSHRPTRDEVAPDQSSPPEPRGTGDGSRQERLGHGESLIDLPVGLDGTGWRTESDSLGAVRVPADRYWGAQTQRSLTHFSIGTDRMPLAGLLERGESTDTAEEIAARTVNKERSRAGEANGDGRTPTDDCSSGRRRGCRSHSGPRGRTLDQFYNEARVKGIRGRSKMTKAQLQRVVDDGGVRS